MRIVLASKSPRRSELLRQIGVEFECKVSGCEEKTDAKNARDVVLTLSEQKAEAVWIDISNNCEDDMSGTLVIGADTVVEKDGNILGKPADEAGAVEMLKMLSGGWHSVWTGVTLIYNEAGNTLKENFARETRVKMYELTEREIEDYVNSKEPADKAGAYAIQGLGARFIEEIEGDYNNVVGLPAAQIYQRIKKFL